VIGAVGVGVSVDIGVLSFISETDEAGLLNTQAPEINATLVLVGLFV
jgi:hypothetical protein